MRTLIRITILILVINHLCFAQGGLGVGFHRNGFVNYNFEYYFLKSHFFIGGVNQTNTGVIGSYRSVQLQNYGRTIINRGSYKNAVRVGYAYEPIKKLTVGVEFIGGNESYYTNYSDLRFKGGGYHLINRKKFINSLGLFSQVEIYKGFGLEFGYNNLFNRRINIFYRVRPENY